MTIRQIVKDTEENGVNFQNVLDSFFMREDQDAFARSQGWEDATQMIYYENLAMQEASQQDLVLHELAKVDSREVFRDPEWDAEVQNILKRAEQKRLDELARLHELAKVDSREVYNEDMAGVY